MRSLRETSTTRSSKNLRARNPREDMAFRERSFGAVLSQIFTQFYSRFSSLEKELNGTHAPCANLVVSSILTPPFFGR